MIHQIFICKGTKEFSSGGLKVTEFDGSFKEALDKVRTICKEKDGWIETKPNKNNYFFEKDKEIVKVTRLP